ncbi:MAG: SAM-dependent methyltransferase [Gammaproteobacteria bacterium]|nr:SAM-dependent methyltransferase [Gammaproteobacteria bacterium]
MPIDFPVPNLHGQDISRKLSERITQELLTGSGWMPFDQYMHQVLYDPELGYYHNGSQKFGSAGDFITAPELSGLFAQSLAEPIINILAQMDDPVIIEFGAGTGRLAEDLISVLNARSVSPRYYILETSAELRARQQSRLSATSTQVEWLEQLPTESFHGVVLANEVLDAFPASCFIKQGHETRPLGVQVEKGELAWAEGNAENTLSEMVEAIESRLGYVLPDGYRSEISPTRNAWIASIAGVMKKGAILTIDYGLTEREYYHEQRNSGTLACYFRHRMNHDPFLWPGLQDISTWVDFSACARAAKEAGLSVAGYTTQGQFLVNSGAIGKLDFTDSADAIQAAQSLKTLVLPGEMGERFKIMLLSRNLHLAPLPGRDFRGRI